jgi:VanZ family protein
MAFYLDKVMKRNRISNWLPALVIMGCIFWFSSQPSASLPNFNWADAIVKKGGHVTGYGLLAWSYWHALVYRKEKRWLTWVLVILYAMTDEFHQSFVAGRHSSIWDVLIFDNLGALLSLWITSYRKQVIENKNDQTKPDR